MDFNASRHYNGERSSFWKGRRVLVTGHTGFVGAWLCCVLKSFGTDVTGFSLKEEAGSLYDKIKGDLNIKNTYGDLRNPDELTTCIESCDPEIVFHIAAYGFVKECRLDPERAFSTNVDGTVNLMNALKMLDHPVRIIVASSDKVYQNSGKDRYLFTEKDPLGGTDPYSASKTCEDITARGLFETYFDPDRCSLCVVRPSNILGGGDHLMTRLVPGMFYSIAHGEAPVLRNPSAIRPWQHILDMTDAYMVLAERCNAGSSIYNVGPEPDGIKTVREIADHVMDLYEQNGDTVFGVRPYGEADNRDHIEDIRHKDADDHEDDIKHKGTDDHTDDEAKTDIEKKYLGLSIDKIRSEIGWAPKKTLEQTLDDIYEFYMSDDGKNTYDLCIKQIMEYYKAG